MKYELTFREQGDYNAIRCFHGIEYMPQIITVASRRRSKVIDDQRRILRAEKKTRDEVKH